MYEWPLLYVCLILFCFKQYLVRGDQFSEGGLNEALMKRKKEHQTNGITKSSGGSIWLGSKVPF